MNKIILRIKCFFIPKLSAEIVGNQKFEYMMLDRLKQDCEYYLGYGNRCPRHLWTESEEAQIAEMKRLYKLLIFKPEWISMRDIKQYEKQMILTRKGL